MPNVYIGGNYDYETKYSLRIKLLEVFGVSGIPHPTSVHVEEVLRLSVVSLLVRENQCVGCSSTMKYDFINSKVWAPHFITDGSFFFNHYVLELLE